MWSQKRLIEGLSRTKAQLVAQGFEEMDANTTRKDSPTCGRENLRLILLIINLNRWKINTVDIKSAWYFCVKKELLKRGGIKSMIMHFFKWHQNNQLQGILSSYVDDFFWAGTE